MTTHPPIDSRIKEIRNWIDSDDYAGDPGCGDCHDARDWLEKAIAIIADLRGNPSPDSLCDDIQKNAENYVKYGLGQQAMITETTGKTRDGDPSGRRPNAVSGAKAGAAAIALLEPIANFDWIGKWRIQKALEKLIFKDSGSGAVQSAAERNTPGPSDPDSFDPAQEGVSLMPESAPATPAPDQFREVTKMVSSEISDNYELTQRLEESLAYFCDEFPKDQCPDIWVKPISHHCGGITPNDLQALLSILYAARKPVLLAHCVDVVGEFCENNMFDTEIVVKKCLEAAGVKYE